MLVKINNKTLTPGIDFLVDASSKGGEYQLTPKFINGEDLLSKNKIQNLFNNTSSLKNHIFIIKNIEYSADSTKKNKATNKRFESVGCYSRNNK